MTEQPSERTETHLRRHALWQVAWLVVAAIWALPVAYVADERLTEVARKAREQLIVQHQLWELNPEYSGNPKTWTRFAARLLTDNQLLRRVRSKYGELAKEIELDYRRDLSIAQAEVILVAAGAWALPVAALYGLGLFALKRRRPPAQSQPPPASPPDTHSRPFDMHSRYRR